MGSRHRKQDSTTLRAAVAGFSVAAVIGVPSVIAMAIAPSDGPVDVPAASAQSINQPVRLDGRVVAVTPTSVTALGSDGKSVTYQVTPETTSVTQAGGGVGAESFPFTVNDEVSIVGEVRGGTAVATAVAAREATGPAGPPMDYALP